MSDLGTIRFTPRSSGIKLFDRYRIIDEFLKDHFGKNEIAGSTKEEDLKQEIARLKKQLAEAVEVIEFYGNANEYKIVETMNDRYPTIFGDDDFANGVYCGGKRARQYLKDKQGE